MDGFPQSSGEALINPNARPQAARVSWEEQSSFPSVAERIDGTIAYMERHASQPLQVSRLASMANVSPSHFFVLFKRQTGRTPIQYFTEVRMRKARRLLNQTSLSVKEVAAELGFDDPFYFSRVFKSFHEVAPSDYRLLPPAVRYSNDEFGCPSTEVRNFNRAVQPQGMNRVPFEPDRSAYPSSEARRTRRVEEGFSFRVNQPSP